MPWWGIVLCALGTLFLLIFAILMLPAKITVKYSEKFEAYFSVLFYRYPLYPEKKKKLKISDFRIERLKKKKLKAEQKAKTKKERSNKDGKSEENESVFSDLQKLMSVITDISGTVIKTFFGHLRVKIKKLVIIVATDDAAKTAITYGTVTSAVATLMELFESATNIRYSRKAELNVYPDYLCDGFSAEIDISFRLRAWQILDILLKSALKELKIKSNQNK